MVAGEKNSGSPAAVGTTQMLAGCERRLDGLRILFGEDDSINGRPGASLFSTGDSEGTGRGDTDFMGSVFGLSSKLDLKSMVAGLSL